MMVNNGYNGLRKNEEDGLRKKWLGRDESNG